MGVLLFACGVFFVGALLAASSKVRSLASVILWLVLAGAGGGGVSYVLAQIVGGLTYDRHNDSFLDLSRVIGLGLGALIGIWLGPLLVVLPAARALLRRSLPLGAILVPLFVGFFGAIISAWYFLASLNSHSNGIKELVLCGFALASMGMGIVMLMAEPADEVEEVGPSGDASGAPAAGTSAAESSVPTTRDIGKLAPAVLRQVGRLGGVYRRPAPVVPRVHAGQPIPEPIRSFLYDIQWPDVRFKGGPLLPGVFMLGFSLMIIPERAELGAATACGGDSWLIIRLDSPDPSDPFVFMRERGGDEGEQLPLSTLLAQLAPDERYPAGGPQA